MTHTERQNEQGESIPFDDTDFNEIAKIAMSEFGLNLAESKKPLVYSRLSKRVKKRNAASFPEYLSIIKREGEDKERLELISALTTNVTSFFREQHHFDTLKNEVLSIQPSKSNPNHRIRIWSAGCSSGQEPYSIAMSTLEKIPDAASKDVKILATDVDPKIVAKAKEGVYSKSEAQGIPLELQSNWTQNTGEGAIKVGPDASNLVTFAELNLIGDWPFNGPFDAIFCRNVAIYFNQETQRVLWKRFCDMLIPGGFLFIGHSERLSGPATREVDATGITTYRKPSNR